jgi:glyoxylase-like metal-dependent hydrolase (beta-lactamase superfamily II)
MLSGMNVLDLNRRGWFRAVAMGSAGFLAARYMQAQGELMLQPLSDGFHVLVGGGGNITVLDTKDGLLSVDSGLPNTADAVIGKVKSVAAVPVKVLIDTHWHSDHVGGNEVFGKNEALIVAHVNTLKRVSEKQHMLFFNRDVEPLAALGLPKKTFTGKEKMTFGTETLEIVHHPPAHTDGDTTVFFPKSNILATGDLLFSGAYPFIDYSSGGNIEGMIHNSAMIVKMTDAQTKIVPGHGPVATKADVQKFHDVLADVNGSVSALIKQGKTADEVLAAGPSKKYDAEFGNGFMKGDQFVKLLYQGKTMGAAKAA